MMFSLFCLYIATIVLTTDANSLPGKSVDFAVFQKKLHGVHLEFQKSAKAKGYLLTETHFETKVKTICTQTGCSSSAEEKKENDKKCPKGWKKFSGNCYRLLSSGRNWYSAKTACKSLKANLADITSKSENQWIHKTFKAYLGWKGYIWIGATDRTKEGEWRWSSSGKLLTYTAWAKGEPNDAGGREDCGHLYIIAGKLSWNDKQCRDHIQTLCKKKA